MQHEIAMIGECMLELSQQSTDTSSRSLPMSLSYGGDTLNSAVYLARQGIAVDYVTALGDDAKSDWMIEQWQGENVGCDLVAQHPNSVPGLYMIEVDEQGERSFHYWRDNAPAKRLFEDEHKAQELFAKLNNYKWLCLSGITLGIYSEAAQQCFFRLLADYRKNGGKVIFDSNYRPKLWKDKETTRKAYEAMYQLTDLALPTVEDEQELFGDADHNAVIARLQSWGVSEIVVKMGEKGCLVVNGETQTLVPSNKVSVVDTTSAGDSFNAGYLAERLKGSAPEIAAKNGHKLASVVIQHRGAIIPLSAMP